MMEGGNPVDGTTARGVPGFVFPAVLKNGVARKSHQTQLVVGN
jgi:hypothetical protein